MPRVDRWGDPIEDDEQQPEQHDQRCRDGWLGEDKHDRPIPCLRCRPHLRRELA